MTLPSSYSSSSSPIWVLCSSFFFFFKLITDLLFFFFKFIANLLFFFFLVKNTQKIRYVFCRNCFKKCVFKIVGGSLRYDTAQFKIANSRKCNTKWLAFYVFIQKCVFLIWKRKAKLTLSNLNHVRNSIKTTFNPHLTWNSKFRPLIGYRLLFYYFATMGYTNIR